MTDLITFDYMDQNGKFIKCNIIDRFSSGNKNYIIYDINGSDDIYSALYEIIDDKIKIIEITDSKDYDIVDKYLENL